MILDPEDTPPGFAGKLASFGLTAAELSEKVSYLHNPTPDEIRAAQRWATTEKYDLVVYDGLAEILAAEGLSEDSPLDLLPFFRNRIRPFAEAGAAILMSDHVVKNPEAQGRWARGSGAKLGRYDGISYSLKLGEAYSPDVAGFVRLVISKDRPGGIGVVGQLVAELHFAPSGNGTTRIEWKQPVAKDDFMPTVLMEKIRRRLTIDPSASLRDLRSLGNSDYVDQAIVKLEELGYVRVIRRGQRRATSFELLKVFVPDNP
jgi:hypothetical protein